MKSLLLINYLLVVISLSCAKAESILVVNVATEETDGYLRYVKSAKQHGVAFTTLGMGEDWKGGDMNHPGGGYKVNELKRVVEHYKNNDPSTIILFTDSYDVIFLSKITEVVKKFRAADASILFSAEHFCWPDAKLESKYPTVSGREARFLNSGMFMGYIQDIAELLSRPIKDTDDDQLYYTEAFLDKEFRTKHNMKLDTKSEVFQNLHGATTSIKLEIDPVNGEASLINTDFETQPSIVHGNGKSKINLNSLSNYLIDTFVDDVCTTCQENAIELDEQKLPLVSMAIFVEAAMPFFEEFLDKILALNYPKDKIHLLIHNNVNYHSKLVDKFVQSFGKEYKSIKEIKVDDSINEANARELAVKQAITRESDYLFVVDSEVHLDHPDLLRDLIKQNRKFISPMVTRLEQIWSNFWGALSENGFYARSNDYLDIVNNKIRGIWNVPFVSSCYLMKKEILPKISYKFDNMDPDMALCRNLREENIFMHVMNFAYYGHLVDNEFFSTKLTKPDFYMLLSNQADWEQRYIDPEYLKHLDPNHKSIEPCPDVYWFPITTEQFCDDLIAIMENYGKWSDGSNNDNRLDGGYEAVPTRDIHMNQVELEPLWLRFLKLYVRPLQEKVFLGYYHNPPRSLMNFIVRYRPDEQPFLRPHHDSSTYTINIALNRAGIDYEGGGCRFLRYNCSVEATKKGWMLMHPGRLTHFHEGLRVTNGTRYIMISFVDP